MAPHPECTQGVLPGWTGRWTDRCSRWSERGRGGGMRPEESEGWVSVLPRLKELRRRARGGPRHAGDHQREAVPSHLPFHCLLATSPSTASRPRTLKSPLVPASELARTVGAWAIKQVTEREEPFLAVAPASRARPEVGATASPQESDKLVSLSRSFSTQQGGTWRRLRGAHCSLTESLG